MAGASSRLLRAGMAPQAERNHQFPASTSCSSNPCRLPYLKFPFLRRNGLNSHDHHGKHKIVSASLGAIIALLEKYFQSYDLGELRRVTNLWDVIAKELLPRRLLMRLFGVARVVLIQKYWVAVSEILIEKTIIGCQSFTLLGVAGSLLGSALCFVEGCFAVVKSFFEYFCAISHRLDQGEITKLLIEALDIFLIGTAMLTFGMGLYTMFAGSKETQRERELLIEESNLGSFNLKKLKLGMEPKSFAHAKTRIGHAFLLLLQAGVLEKFSNVPLDSGLDLACFAGAVFASSAGVFLLSKLKMQQQYIKV